MMARSRSGGYEATGRVEDMKPPLAIPPPGGQTHIYKFGPRLRATIERENDDGGTETVLSVEGEVQVVWAAIKAAMTPTSLITRESARD